MRLIDADALLNDSSIVYHTEFGDAVVDVEDIKKAPTIKTFTLADIEENYRKGIEKGLEEARPHGEWIPKDLHNCWTKFECSVCGYYHQPVHDFGESKPDFNFCPSCGASMQKEGEGE